MPSRFYDIDPTLENYWRGVILFGRNVASYKFALAKSLLELADKKSDFIPLEELAEPFSRHIVEHVKSGHKQATSSSSRFIEACEQYCKGAIITTNSLVPPLNWVSPMSSMHFTT